jgi:hypothetical protein
MPPSRITIRLGPVLEARMSDRVGHGYSMSDIVRDALEAYLSDAPSPRQTPLSDTRPGLSDTTPGAADTLSDILARLGTLE